MKLTKKLMLSLDEFKDGFGLGFDLSKVQENLRDLLREMNGIKICFSVKSFPREEFLNSISEDISGWDVASLREFRLIEKNLRPHHSIWITNSHEDFVNEAIESKCPVFFTLDKTFDVQKLPKNINLGIRLDPYSLLGKGHSRFGFLISDLKSLSLDKFSYIHTHLPGEFSDKELEVVCTKIKELLPLFSNVRQLNLGGGLRSDNLSFISNLKALFPGVTLVLEPGRYLSESAGGAVTKILSVFKKEDDLYLLGKLSPVSHLNWAKDMTFTVLPQGEGSTYSYKRLIYVSANAYEADQIILEDKSGKRSISVGDYIIFDNISGYSVAWNRSFNGIAEAPVVFIR